MLWFNDVLMAQQHLTSPPWNTSQSNNYCKSEGEELNSCSAELLLCCRCYTFLSHAYSYTHKHTLSLDINPGLLLVNHQCSCQSQVIHTRVHTLTQACTTVLFIAGRTTHAAAGSYFLEEPLKSSRSTSNSCYFCTSAGVVLWTWDPQNGGPVKSCSRFLSVKRDFYCHCWLLPGDNLNCARRRLKSMHTCSCHLHQENGRRGNKKQKYWGKVLRDPNLGFWFYFDL